MRALAALFVVACSASPPARPIAPASTAPDPIALVTQLGGTVTREITRDGDKIAAKLPEAYRPYMAYTFVSLCDDSRKAEIEKFFRPRIEKLDGGELAMKQALEALTLCSAQRKAQAPGVIAFLKKQ